MTARGDPTQVVRAWLQEGPEVMSDWVLDAVVDQLPTRPQRRGLWRRSTGRLSLRMAIAVGALIVLAAAGLVAAGWSLLNRPTPSPNPGPTNTPSALSDAAFVDDLLARWNADDPAGLSAFYDHTVGVVRFVIDSDDVVASYLIDSTAIEAQRAPAQATRYELSRAGPVERQGPLAAFPTTIRSAAGEGGGITVLQRTAEGLVLLHFVIGSSTPADEALLSGTALSALFDDELTARNAYDGPATGAFFDVGAVERASRTGEWEPDGTVVGRGAIAARVGDPPTVAEGWHILRTGDVLVQGLYAAYPARWTSSAGKGDEGFRVFRLTPEGLIQDEWSIGRVLNAPPA